MNEKQPLTLRFAPADPHGQQPELPAYQTAGAAARDVRAWLPQGELTLAPGQRALVPTGMKIAVPEGWAALLLARSGLAAKSGIALANGVGLIDSDYRGELKVAVINLSSEGFTLRHGDRVAQLMLIPAPHFSVTWEESLDETARGEGGFGSTRI